MTDAKFPDFQAGAERASTVLSAALSGANIVYESAGMYASLLGTCPESLLLDNDVLGAVGRVTRGIEVNSDTLSFAEIERICSSGEGHYLGSGSTLQVMQSEYIYPDFSDRTSPTVWEEQGKPVLLHQALEKTREILARPAPRHVSDEIDARLRSGFPIFLSRTAIGR
jgi:trimethylamine--corrinoid protein Co-methyltransferase